MHVNVSYKRGASFCSFLKVTSMPMRHILRWQNLLPYRSHTLVFITAKGETHLNGTELNSIPANTGLGPQCQTAAKWWCDARMSLILCWSGQQCSIRLPEKEEGNGVGPCCVNHSSDDNRRSCLSTFLLLKYFWEAILIILTFKSKKCKACFQVCINPDGPAREDKISTQSFSFHVKYDIRDSSHWLELLGFNNKCTFAVWMKING